MNSIDLLTPLRSLETLAANSQTRGEFMDGYLMAIRHAIELAEVQQQRIALFVQYVEQTNRYN